MIRKQSKISKNLTVGLLASAMALTAFAVNPTINGSASLFSVSPAMADAVKVDAPEAPGFADVVEAVSPAVVSVRVEQMVQPASDDEGFRFDRRFGRNGQNLPEFFRNNPELFERFFGERGRGFGDNHRKKRRFGQSQGSGFFISED